MTPRDGKRTNLKDTVCTFKLSTADREVLDKLAADAGMTLSAWIRAACLRAAGILP